ELLLRRRLSEEIVDAGFGGDGRRGDRIVAGDHHGADAHAPEFGKPLADAAFDDVLEMDHTEQLTVLRHGERRTTGLGDGLGDCVDLPLELSTYGGFARGGCA